MEYNEYAYLYPPRPECKVTQDQLFAYQRRGWVAQVKKNGTCTLVFAKGDEVIFKTRHNEEGTGGDNHKMWKPKKHNFDFFKGRSDKWNVYVAELLNDKTPSIKDHLYIFDQIVHNGVHLVGTNLIERHALLHEQLMTPDAKEEADLYRLGVGVSIARNLTRGFRDVFGQDGKNLKPEDEGLVLKSPTMKLDPCFKQTANNGWQVKVRKLHKNYGF